ncbi:hypothetical protein, partial [Intrasporangium oryzae]|uniref:hypothetical protein n=1 Tax=Intrasporangium oryzae TaxID=412687 RepID=UPI00054FBB53
ELLPASEFTKAHDGKDGPAVRILDDCKGCRAFLTWCRRNKVPVDSATVAEVREALERKEAERIRRREEVRLRIAERKEREARAKAARDAEKARAA